MDYPIDEDYKPDYLHDQTDLGVEASRRAAPFTKQLKPPYVDFDGRKYHYKVEKPDWISKRTWELGVANVTSEYGPDWAYATSWFGVQDIMSQFIPLS